MLHPFYGNAGVLKKIIATESTEALFCILLCFSVHLWQPLLRSSIALTS
jgi:hypothetical protein